MNRLSNMISSMNYKDLKAIEKDLYEGNIARLLKARLEGFEKKFPSNICATCGTVHEGEPRYALFFGPEDFRKKATFCGLDCLNFFVKKLETQHNEVVGNE
ncbi:TPA: hypothetical protein HA239_04680 [Candidatus Woesearchaeota archaeon]|nr:hypothetical protein QT06_C0001G0102 [archaeon GW2011_AR15]MBS3104092.1 hypothetical protein [Candidatus Woesearchaeota archaeon]HIH41683.1 hypothetical protein [Candidatus Woesearchaeota archaeon]